MDDVAAAARPDAGTPRAAPASGPRAPEAEAEAATAQAALASDFETFLSLLTTQMRNQDPLKPLESTEFVAQLASFSAVEQQIRSNDRLDSILAALGADAAGGFAEWIDKEVLSEAPTRFDGAPVEIAATPPAGADRAVLVVSDAAGAPVARLPADPGAERLVWSGETGSGPAPTGAYGFAINYMKDDEALATVPGRTYSRVVELRLDGESPRLGLAGGGETTPDEVASVRSVAP